MNICIQRKLTINDGVTYFIIKPIDTYQLCILRKAANYVTSPIHRFYLSLGSNTPIGRVNKGVAYHCRRHR